MSKEEFEQRWAKKYLKETLSTVEERVGKLEGSMEDVKEAFSGVEDRIANWKEDKLLERNDALEAMMIALKEGTMATTRALSTIIEKLEGELALFRAAVENGVANAVLSKEDVSKPKEFVGTRSVCEVDNFL
ncbi:hypothetical protein Golob_007046 [Gossypium lobatum]|uniref:Uncharacterized protein n=1 Tax=Gossypium lobatum TaxID=34289 RepID=A0A7J8NG82_9ROSI|nr:hypothetical protein [Gossypium lobatum]